MGNFVHLARISRTQAHGLHDEDPAEKRLGAVYNAPDILRMPDQGAEFKRS